MRQIEKAATAVSVTAALVLSTNALATNCEVPSGSSWINDLGSQMSLTIDSTGAIDGSYETAVGCGAGKPRAVTGFCNGHAIAFTVNWEECVSVTSWSGTYESGTITTLWDLVLAGKPQWNSIVAGTDVFTEQ